MQTKQEWENWFNTMKKKWRFPDGIGKKEVGTAMLQPDFMKHIMPIAREIHNGVLSSLTPGIYDMRGFKAGMICGNISMLNALSMISVRTYPIAVMADLDDKGNEDENLKVVGSQLERVRAFVNNIETSVVRIASIYTIPVYTTWLGGDNEVAKDGVTYPSLFGVLLFDECEDVFTRLSAINLDMPTKPDPVSGGTFYPAASTAWRLDETGVGMREMLLNDKWEGVQN